MRPIGNIKGEEKIVIEERSRIDTLRAGFEKMIAERKAEAEKNKIGEEPPIEAPIVTQCALDEPNKEFNFNKNVVVGDECDESEWLCNSSQKDVLDFEIQCLPNPS